MYCIRISYPILDFVQQKKTRFTMKQPYLLPILYCQYHGCWCPGTLRSQGISSHDIDSISSILEKVDCVITRYICIFLRLFSQLKSCKKFLYFDFDSNCPIRLKICTCHDSWAVVTCAKVMTWCGHWFSYKNNTYFCKIQVVRLLAFCEIDPSSCGYKNFWWALWDFGNQIQTNKTVEHVLVSLFFFIVTVAPLQKVISQP